MKIISQYSLLKLQINPMAGAKIFVKKLHQKYVTITFLKITSFCTNYVHHHSIYRRENQKNMKFLMSDI